MKNITINNKATIKVEGKRESKLCKPVICIETGEVFASSADAAEYMGVHYTMMSAACIGKVKTCKGKHFCYLNSALENLDAVMTRLREANEMEADAKKWREQEAAERLRLEEERKAKERHDADVERAKAKVSKLAMACAKYQEKLNEATIAYDEANRELDALLNGDAEV